MFEPYAACYNCESVANANDNGISNNVNDENPVYDWNYFKNKYSNFIRNEKKTETKKRKYGDAFDQSTYDYSRFGKIVGDNYRFEINGTEFHIPFYTEQSVNMNLNDEKEEEKETDKEEEKETDKEEEKERLNKGFEEGIKITFEEIESESESEIAHESESGEVFEEDKMDIQQDYQPFDYENFKNDIDSKFNLIYGLLSELQVDYSVTRKKYVETLY